MMSVKKEKPIEETKILGNPKIIRTLKDYPTRIILIILISLIFLFVYFIIANYFDKKYIVVSSNFEMTDRIVDTTILLTDSFIFNEINAQILDDLDKYSNFIEYTRINHFKILPYVNLKQPDVILFLDRKYCGSGGFDASVTSRYSYNSWLIQRTIDFTTSCRFDDLCESNTIIPKEVIEKYKQLKIIDFKIEYKSEIDSNGDPIVEITNRLESDVYGYNRQYIELLVNTLKFNNIQCKIKNLSLTQTKKRKITDKAFRGW